MESKVSSTCSQQPATFHILTQINTVCDFPSYFVTSILVLFRELLTGLFPSVTLIFPTKTLYIFLLLPVRATYPAHLNFPKFITPRSVTILIMKLLIMYFFPFVRHFLLRPTCCPQLAILRYSLTILLPLVSHPYRPTGKIVVQHNFMFVVSKWEYQIFWT